jgi:N-glycosidase YbiA
MAIDTFRGEYFFLSNFCPVIWVCLDGDERGYPSVEHAYQAAKCRRRSDRDFILEASSPGEAKRRARQVEIVRDWDNIKLSVMEKLLRQKFAKEPFRSQLLSTGDQELIEGNTWGDTFWGVCRGQGQNHLGRLLMEIRADIRAEDSRIAQG